MKSFVYILFTRNFVLSSFSAQCKKKYETAQVLLQGLEEDAHTDEDRRLLHKCILLHLVIVCFMFIPSAQSTQHVAFFINYSSFKNGFGGLEILVFFK